VGVIGLRRIHGSVLRGPGKYIQPRNVLKLAALIYIDSVSCVGSV